MSRGEGRGEGRGGKGEGRGERMGQTGDSTIVRPLTEAMSASSQMPKQIFLLSDGAVSESIYFFIYLFKCSFILMSSLCR